MIRNLSGSQHNGLLLSEITPEEILSKCTQNESFVVNIVTSWCPDCTVRQAMFIEDFAQKLISEGLDVYQCTVQRERDVFISQEHAQFTEKCGGHGYPRTVLFVRGDLTDWDNVEIVSEHGLGVLAVRFLEKIRAAK